MGLFASADAFQVANGAGADDRELLDKVASCVGAHYAIDKNANSIIVHADVSIELRVSKVFTGLVRIGIFLDEELPRKSRNEQVLKVFGPLVDSGVIAAIRFSKPAFFPVIFNGAEMHLYGQRDLVGWLARNGSIHDSIFRPQLLEDLSIVRLTIRGAREIEK